MISTLAVIGAIVGAISGLASLALLLLFLWPVYDRGGRTDLVAAGKALRQVYDRPWSAKEPLRTELVDRLRTPTSEVTDVKLI